MKTTKVQIKQVVFVFLTLLLFGAIVVHSDSTCAPQTQSLDKLTQIVSQLQSFLQYHPPTAPTCLSSMAGLQITLAAIPANPTESQCSNVNFDTIGNQISQCDAQFSTFEKSVTNTLDQTQSAANDVSCDYCCAATEKSCLEQCTRETSTTPALTAQMQATCRSKCSDSYDSCLNVQQMCHTGIDPLKTQVQNLVLQWTSTMISIEKPLSSAKSQLSSAKSHCQELVPSTEPTTTPNVAQSTAGANIGLDEFVPNGCQGLGGLEIYWCSITGTTAAAAETQARMEINCNPSTDSDVGNFEPVNQVGGGVTSGSRGYQSGQAYEIRYIGQLNIACNRLKITQGQLQLQTQSNYNRLEPWTWFDARSQPRPNPTQEQCMTLGGNANPDGTLANTVLVYCQ